MVYYYTKTYRNLILTGVGTVAELNFSLYANVHEQFPPVKLAPYPIHGMILFVRLLNNFSGSFISESAGILSSKLIKRYLFIIFFLVSYHGKMDIISFDPVTPFKASNDSSR